MTAAVATARAGRVRGVILGNTWFWPAGQPGMKLFSPAGFLPRMKATFLNNVTVELPHARHYIQEGAPEEIAQAISQRFG